MIDLRTCPTCQSPKIRKLRRTVTRLRRGKPFTVPHLLFHECPDCGEMVFSPEAMEKIEACRRAPVKATA